MKKILKFLPLFLMAVLTLGITSCSDDKDEPVSPTDLPIKAKEFISTYFPSANIVRSIKDGHEYEATLSDGTRIDFDKKGEWQDVDAPLGMTIPSGFYPQAIDENVAQVSPEAGINEISKEKYGYEVELVSGVDMRFDHDGAFLGFDR